MEKQIKFFGFEVVDVGHLTGWTPGNCFEAILADEGRARPLRFRVARHDDGKNWTAMLEQLRDGGVAFRLDGDDLEKLVAQCEGRTRELLEQLGALVTPP